MIALTDRLSIGTLLRLFWGKIAATVTLTLLEAFLFVLLPLLIGYSIDGLIAHNWNAFTWLLIVLGTLVAVATCRRFYDTRAYGTIRVKLSEALVERSGRNSLSVTNARVLMGKELVDFLENHVPTALSAVVQVVVSVVLLFSFHSTLALSAGLASLGILVIFALSARFFYRGNQNLNEQAERQIAALETRNMKQVANHFLRMRRHEVRLSDTESIVYGMIFLLLLSMMAFNLWFAATNRVSTPGEIFSIVSYSFEFVEASVAIPAMLQTLTRLHEITERLNAIGQMQNDAVA